MYGMFRPSGSLTTGNPQATYPAGSYQFRTPFLVLVLEPVVGNAAFVTALNRALAVRIPGASLRSGSIGVSAPFQQSVDRNEAGLLDRALSQDFAIVSAGSAIAASTSAPGVGIGGASFLGWLIGTPLGAIASHVIPDRVPARWVTVAGTIDSPASSVSTDVVTHAIAAALNETMRFRVPQPPYQMVAPQAESVVARTREAGACSGHVRSDKVIAAACTRLEPTAPPQSAAAPQPGASIAPWATPLAPSTTPGKGGTATVATPRPTTTVATVSKGSEPSVYGPSDASVAAPANDMTPWLIAGGLVLTLGVVAYVAIGDD